jgi:hypothetical protein
VVIVSRSTRRSRDEGSTSVVPDGGGGMRFGGAQPRLARGQCGKSRGMDKDSFVEALNDDLRSEYQSSTSAIPPP